MRLSFDGLYALVVGQLQHDPTSGHLFLFANKRRDRMKILFFDGSSLWVCSRRMEQGPLHWPSCEEGRLEPGVSSDEIEREVASGPLPECPGNTQETRTPTEKQRARRNHPGRNELPAHLERVEQIIACTARSEERR